jgi:sugar lactone lactonase YvrE
MKVSTGPAFGAVVAAALSTSLGACFPEDQLRPPRDASVDVRRVDVVTAMDVEDLDAASAPDVVVKDRPTVDVADVGLTDAPAAPRDVDQCAMVPSGRVPAMPVFADLANAKDMAFDGRGGLAVATGASIVVVARGGITTQIVPMARGDVTALRYTRGGQLVFAASALTDAGTVSGGIYVLEPGTPPPSPTTRWMPTGRVNGLAVNPDGSVWYSDTSANTVYRLSVLDSAAPEVVVRGDIPAPRALAFDATGRVLYAGGSNGVYSLSLDPEDGGVARARQVFAGTDTVLGLATDTCGNLWVAEGRPAPAASRVLRWDGTQLSVIYESADGVSAVAFGQGGDFDDRVLFFLQERANAVRAVGVVARGVARPAPTP